MKKRSRYWEQVQPPKVGSQRGLTGKDDSILKAINLILILNYVFCSTFHPICVQIKIKLFSDHKKIVSLKGIKGQEIDTRQLD